jgi:hypothetical protein
MIENGLNQMSANPYLYRLATGAIIFVAMYVDALKSGRLGASFASSTATGEAPRISNRGRGNTGSTKMSIVPWLGQESFI